MAGTVTVGCRLPHGLVLQAYEWVEKTYFNKEGMSRTVKEAQPMEGSGKVVINGNARRPGEDKLDVYGDPISLASGYAITQGVDQELWDAWYEANKNQAYIKNEMVFAFPNLRDMKAKARENIDIRSGFEKINPDGDGRMPGNRIGKEGSGKGITKSGHGQEA